MHVAAITAFVLSLVLYVASLILPANHDWLGFLWAAYAVEAVARGPRYTSDYALVVLVTAANFLFALAPLTFPFARSASAKVLPYLLLLALAGGVWARFAYRQGTWAFGFDVWCAALAVMAVAMALRVRASAPRTPALALVGRRPGSAPPRDSNRRTGTR